MEKKLKAEKTELHRTNKKLVNEKEDLKEENRNLNRNWEEAKITISDLEQEN